jgi:nitrite reductase/ring-hydroxylating ferredoxin subunit
MPIDRAEPGVPASLAFAATYNREVRFGIDRIWENLLDWEHLPALHEIFFDDVALLEIGSWGWRVELTKTPGTAGRRMVVELRIDRANARYCARTLAGDGAGTEIWTLQEALGPQRTAVEVRFYLPERRPDRLAALGEKYRSSYACLWDQDEAMMMRREALSTRGRTRRKAFGAPLALGALCELRQRLPLLVKVDGEPVRLLALEDGALVAHSTICPHWLGPFEDVVPENGKLRCPWHGYLFDVRTGMSAEGCGYRLAPSPLVVVDPVTGEVTLNAGPDCRRARRGERAIVSPRSPGPRHRERRPAPEPR